jgi:hypothetical protein
MSEMVTQEISISAITREAALAKVEELREKGWYLDGNIEYVYPDPIYPAFVYIAHLKRRIMENGEVLMEERPWHKVTNLRYVKVEWPHIQDFMEESGYDDAVRYDPDHDEYFLPVKFIEELENKWLEWNESLNENQFEKEVLSKFPGGDNE